MEKTTLEGLDWVLSKGASRRATRLLLLLRCGWACCAGRRARAAGDQVAPEKATAPHRTLLHGRRRFQFSSALKCLSEVVSVPRATGSSLFLLSARRTRHVIPAPAARP